MSNLIELNEANFDANLAKSKMMVIDFWASWCGPCKNFAPTFENVAKKHPEITFAKVDIDANSKLAEEFNVRSIPYVMIIREEVALYANAGALKESDLDELVIEAKGMDMKAIHERVKNHEHHHHHGDHGEGCC